MTDHSVSAATERDSELEQVRAQLASDWEWLVLLAETTNDVIFSFSLWPERRCNYISPSVESMVGYTPQEHYLNPRLSLVYVHPDDRSKLEDLFESPQDHPERIPLRWIHKDGSVVWTEATISVVRDGAGRPTAIRGIGRDVSRHKRRDLEMESHRRSLGAVVENSPIGIFVVNTQGEVLIINREAARILGSTAGAQRTLDWYANLELRRAEDGSIYKASETPLQRALLLGQRVVAEDLHIARPDGVSTRVLVNSGPVTPADGVLIGAVATIQDLSQWEVDAGLRVEAISALGRRLREPVIGIKGLLGLIANGDPLDDSWFEIFGLMEREVASLDRLVSNISNWASFRFSKMEISPRTAGADEVLDPCLVGFNRLGHPQRLSVERDGILPPFVMDVAKVRHAIDALLDYVARNCPAGGGMQLSATAHDDSVSFTIQGGLELDASKTSQNSLVLPEKDVRLESGDVLELSLARAVAEAHGGRFWTRAVTADLPLTVSLTLPTAGRFEYAESGQNDSALGRRPLDGRRVLVASNDISLLRLVRRAVSEAGGMVQICSTADDVLDSLKLGETDMAFVSVELVGGANGAAALVDALEAPTVQTPVVWLIEDLDGEIDSLSIVAAADTDFIVSPPSTVEVIGRAYRALSRRDPRLLPPSEGVFDHDGLTVDLTGHQVTLEGREIKLSPMEFRLLEQLTLNAGRAMTHRQLLQRVWGTTYSEEIQLVHSMVRNLRRRLGDNSDEPRWIVNVPSIGYKLSRS
jgi:PAS domain S-box-containing protein